MTALIMISNVSAVIYLPIHAANLRVQPKEINMQVDVIIHLCGKRNVVLAYIYLFVSEALDEVFLKWNDVYTKFRSNLTLGLISSGNIYLRFLWHCSNLRLRKYWKSFPVGDRGALSYTVDINAADGLATKGVKSSAAVVLKYFPPPPPPPPPESFSLSITGGN